MRAHFPAQPTFTIAEQASASTVQLPNTPKNPQNSQPGNLLAGHIMLYSKDILSYNSVESCKDCEVRSRRSPPAAARQY